MLSRNLGRKSFLRRGLESLVLGLGLIFTVGPGCGEIEIPCREGDSYQETCGAGDLGTREIVCINGRYVEKECGVMDSDGDGDPDRNDPNPNDPRIYTKAPELCDKIDNNADGMTDVSTDGEPLVEPCYTGLPETRKVGICQDGLRRCIEGEWENECRGEILPEEEDWNGEEGCDVPALNESIVPDLDGKDNDCDGLVDQHCMIEIPAGSFMMGCDISNEEQNEYCNNGEFSNVPARTVTLTHPYLVDKFEVPLISYRHCVENGACPAYPLERTANSDDYAPIGMLQWTEAESYCQWAGKTLLTEAQWEKAARGIDGRIFPWGNEEGEACTHGNFSSHHRQGGCAGEERLSLIGSYPRGVSSSGLYDLAGNVAEWVNDWFAPYELDDFVNPIGPAEGILKIWRGGGYQHGREGVTTFGRSFVCSLAFGRMWESGVRCGVGLK